jgi:membrane protein implicated in regulation of membrane protease activity
MNILKGVIWPGIVFFGSFAVMAGALFGAVAIGNQIPVCMGMFIVAILVAVGGFWAFYRPNLREPDGGAGSSDIYGGADQ